MPSKQDGFWVTACRFWGDWHVEVSPSYKGDKRPQEDIVFGHFEDLDSALASRESNQARLDKKTENEPDFD